MKIENITFAACSAFKPETGSPSVASGGGWFQTFPPYGRYPVGGIIPGAPEGAEFVFDEAAAKSIIENFRAEAKKTDWPGILVDREHFSADREKTSDAMAWAKDIRQEADGSIWTRWEFTAPGKELWEGKVLINRSPLFACAKDGKTYHPLALKSIGMTNTPHFTELSTIAAAKAAEGTNTMKYDLEHLIARARALTHLAAAKSDECRAADPSKCRTHGTPDKAKELGSQHSSKSVDMNEEHPKFPGYTRQNIKDSAAEWGVSEDKFIESFKHTGGDPMKMARWIKTGSVNPYPVKK